MKGKGKKRSYKELLDENKELKEENTTLKEQLCKCTPLEGTPKGRQCEVAIFDDSIPPAKIEENVVSKADFNNL